MADTPEFKKNTMYQFLREGEIEEFNKRRAAGHKTDLAHADFRGVDLRGLNADGIDFSRCYFRQADLRGIDFSKAKLEGASINGSKISGCYFPVELSAEEIIMSLTHGTRMRYNR